VSSYRQTIKESQGAPFTFHNLAEDSRASSINQLPAPESSAQSQHYDIKMVFTHRQFTRAAFNGCFRQPAMIHIFAVQLTFFLPTSAKKIPTPCLNYDFSERI
jgi:hypothetical protein